MRDFGARDSSARGRDARGQTTIDYGIGVSVFLVTVVFIFMFIPSMFTPFVSNQSFAITADRTADTLSEQLLLSDGKAEYMLDDECTRAFFGQFEGEDPPERCNYEAYSDAESHFMTRALGEEYADSSYEELDESQKQDVEEAYLREVLGLSGTTGIEVTIETMSEGVEDRDGRYSDVANMEGTELRVGRTPPTHGNVVASQRTVHVPYWDFDKDAYTRGDFRLFVRMW